LTGDRRRDGLTLGTWYRGLSIVSWDVTVVNTSARDHCKDSARQTGEKYHDCQSNYHFQLVAIETTHVYGKSTTTFLSDLINRLTDVSNIGLRASLI